MSGKIFTITQETEYPWNGNVKISIKTQKRTEFTMALRIPGWTQNQPVSNDLYRYLKNSDNKASIKVNGELVDIISVKGYAIINRAWKDGDLIEFNMPMPIRRIIAHENVKNNIGKVALERGPIVYCAEWPDNDIEHIDNLLVDDNAKLISEYQADMLNGIVVIKGNVHYLKKTEDGKDILKIEHDLLAIPYYAWAHRGKGEMTVWMFREISPSK